MVCSLMKSVIESILGFSGTGSVGLTRPVEFDLTLADHAEFVICNQSIEQDHRSVKRMTRPMLGFKSFAAAQPTLVGIELMPMLRKGQMEDGMKQGLSVAEQFYALA